MAFFFGPGVLNRGIGPDLGAVYEQGIACYKVKLDAQLSALLKDILKALFVPSPELGLLSYGPVLGPQQARRRKSYHEPLFLIFWNS